MDGWIQVDEAAERLGVHPSRVRLLAREGRLGARRLGRAWLIDADELRRETDRPRHAGRPWLPHVAWAALLLLDGDHDGLLRLPDRARRELSGRVARAGSLAALAPRLSGRAEVRRYRAHPSVVVRLPADGAASGLAAAAARGARLAVRQDDSADMYLPAAVTGRLVDRYQFAPAVGGDANVVLRVVPDDAWMLADRELAPLAAVALDLAEHDDARTREAARRLAGRVDAAWPQA
ncbi:hypothetical protein BH23ACT7_BH23ACT7_26050 [soil metagenome]